MQTVPNESNFITNLWQPHWRGCEEEAKFSNFRKSVLTRHCKAKYDMNCILYVMYTYCILVDKCVSSGSMA